MADLVRHDGTVRQGFGLAIRGQLVDFPTGSRIVAADQSMRDAIDLAGEDVEWDEAAEDTGGADVVQTDGAPPRRRGRPPKA